MVGRLSEYQYVLRNLPTSTDPQWITASLYEMLNYFLTDGDLLVLTVKNTVPEELEAEAERLTEIMRDGTGLATAPR